MFSLTLLEITSQNCPVIYDAKLKKRFFLCGFLFAFAGLSKQLRFLSARFSHFFSSALLIGKLLVSFLGDELLLLKHLIWLSREFIKMLSHNSGARCWWARKRNKVNSSNLNFFLLSKPAKYFADSKHKKNDPL